MSKLASSLCMSASSKLGPLCAIVVVGTTIIASVAAHEQSSAPAAPSEPIDWRATEAGVLEHQTQLSFPEQFVKAGEAYFSPDGARVIFQAVEQPESGREPDEFYAMFVADLVRDEAPRWALANVRRVSPVGSANTCGWFHPTDPDRIMFASTIGPPTASAPPGYQRGTNRYRWSFPPETRIVEANLRTLPVIALRGAANAAVDIAAKDLTVLAGDGQAYVAEGSLSCDGRTLLYCSLAANQGDLLVKDMKSGAVTPIVVAPGYDGGPFFSPDGQRICFRSDRAGNNLLQIYVADLALDATGRVTGASQEYALTANNDVNWCPFWHPEGTHLVYATSAISHRNYEIFLIDAHSDDSATPPQRRYGTNPRRVTNADGADVLPAFDATGRLMMWTSQRASDRTSQLWIADFVMPLAPVRSDAGATGASRERRDGTGASR